MSPKRAAVPSTTFGKAPGALDKLTGRAPADTPVSPQPEESDLPQNSETTVPRNSDAGLVQSSNTVLRRGGTDEKVNTEKFTIYVSPDQMDKLDELALAYRKRTGKRINRNVIMRKLIDVCDLDLLLRSDAE